ncbi:MAG TPA: hypothetical protein DCR14_06780 [Acidimicrobiaceae bacterium]|nr:hypothetical protein [Acidimicrobiaceae bacterium]
MVFKDGGLLNSVRSGEVSVHSVLCRAEQAASALMPPSSYDDWRADLGFFIAWRTSLRVDPNYASWYQCSLDDRIAEAMRHLSFSWMRDIEVDYTTPVNVNVFGAQVFLSVGRTRMSLPASSENVQEAFDIAAIKREQVAEARRWRNFDLRS